jgi:hypothetical protein
VGFICARLAASVLPVTEDDLEAAAFFPALAFFASAFAIDSASQSFFFVAPPTDAFRLLFHSAEP